MNEEITHDVIQTAINCGTREFIVCAGQRNSSFVEALRQEKSIKVFYWPEERSGSFFALGRARLTRQPVAVVVTSGTAAAELLPAAMNAHYLSVPLLLITADRPPEFRGSGAPQAAEQSDLFKTYVSFAQDITGNVPCLLNDWDQLSAAHVNICLNEPQKEPYTGKRPLIIPNEITKVKQRELVSTEELDSFLSHVKYPLVIVSKLHSEAHAPLISFLRALQAPVFLEGISGLREEPSLQHLRIHRTDNILESASANNYNVDGIIRIGGVPTHRIWRDLEYLKDKVKVCNITDTPFSGLSWTRSSLCGSIKETLSNYTLKHQYDLELSFEWLQNERLFKKNLIELYQEFPTAEPALIFSLSRLIPKSSHVYLGNSLPIREWDIAATDTFKKFQMTASRGLNGIDGQISTFLGMCREECDNWAILGDLTTLYDMAGFWILPQLPELKTTTVVINNGGGKLFEKFSPHKEMLNSHNLSFKPLAEMWSLEYVHWTKIPNDYSPKANHRMIEIIPDVIATKDFNKAFQKL